MDEADRKEILRMLAEGFSALRAAIHGVTEVEAAQRPIAGGWSMLDCLEHLAVTERELLTGVQIERGSLQRRRS